ncbi:MAG: lysophospholipase [Thermodesulfobacteriota bacterium]
MTNTAREDRIKTADGTELFILHNPVDRPKGVIIIVHGICEHSGRYDHVVSRLNSQGYSVFRFDLRGHGRSGGERGFVSDFNRFIDDTDEMVNLARKKNPDYPLFLLGHSMGGFISSAYGVRYPDRLRGLIHSGASVIVLPLVAALGDFDYEALALNPIPNDLSEMVSRDPRVVRAYQDDPLVQKEFTTKLMGEIFIRGAKWLMENMKAYQYPCLILHGGGDQIVPPDASRYLYEHISSADKTLKVYDGLFHEILNEPEKETVLDDICQWLEARS